MLSVDEIIKSTQGVLLSPGFERGIHGYSIDSRTIKKGEAFIAIKGDNFDGHKFIGQAIKKGASCIIASSKAKVKIPARVAFIKVADTQKALGDIARSLRVKYNIPVIAISGSVGKTTAKEMLAWVLSAKFKVLSNEGTKNNHIGMPLTLCSLNKNHNLAVLELGTNHFGEIENLSRICLPNIGIITNIGPAHLEHFGNLRGVFKEKYTLIKNLKEPCLAVLNADDSHLRKSILSFKPNPFTISFGIRNSADFSASGIRYGRKGIEFLVNGKHKFILNTAGANNIYNALIAISLARSFGLSYKTIIQRLACFSFPRGRLNSRVLNNVRFIDDTYNSNPLSLGQALEALKKIPAKRKIFVMGDMLELGRRFGAFHREAGFNAARICDIFITVGKLSALAAKQAAACGMSAENIFHFDSAGEAAGILRKKVFLKKGDVILAKGSRAMKIEEVLRRLMDVI